LEKRLNEYSIYALRAMARNIGVSSPTSKKKEHLIQEIMDIYLGKKQPVEAKTKQGRPPKSSGYDFSFNFDQPISPTLVLKQEVDTQFEYNDVINKAGAVELVNNNSGILWVQEGLKYTCYFIPSDALMVYNIKAGDRVVVHIDSFEEPRVKEILSINGVPAMKFDNNRRDYSDIEHSLPSVDLSFVGDTFTRLHIKKGENVYLYGSDNNANTTTIINMLNQCQAKRKIYVNVSLADKNKLYLNNLKDAEMFVANITDDLDHVRRIVALAIERAKRLLENGESVVVAIDDVLSLTGVDKEDLNLTKNIISLTKDGLDAGSITTLAIMPFDKNINQIEKLADKRFKISNNEVIFID